MNILALDTSTESCSVALLIEGQLFEQSIMTQREHSQRILGMMNALFNDAGTEIAAIDAVAFGRGPGSFTGVRVAVSVAQGIAFARDLPVIPVSTLAAVAQAAIESTDCQQIAVAMDARMGEIYTGLFVNQHGLAVPCSEEQVSAPAVFRPEGSGAWTGVGSGWTVYQNELQQNFSDQLSGILSDVLPQATMIAKLADVEAQQGRLFPAAQALPVYLRNNVAQKKAAH
ncbi:MAG: tRNA (adenosine(37)-N6)-threonylcarbamoyltransferase complex dimerization subunit type 1 TsaB [Methylophaga sp.]|nr:tRNA (adenosine(37)-N6)-threonylcarbamoyltransferase complex dimerization subunit type 1 TsaB [Methylophaga sp.]